MYDAAARGCRFRPAHTSLTAHAKAIGSFVIRPAMIEESNGS